MQLQQADLRRIKAHFVLKKLSAPLRADVLADGSIAESFDLELTRRVRLSEEVVLHYDELFAAFREATDGGTTLLLDNVLNGPLEAQVSFEIDGTGIVTDNANRWRFPHAALLSSVRDHRLRALENALQNNTLPLRERIQLRELVGKPEFSNDDYLSVLKTLESSPERFVEKLRESLTTGQLGITDFLPENTEYWDHLTTPEVHSATLLDFIASELRTEWHARITEDPAQAFRSISLTFASPALIPRSLLKGLDAAINIKLLENACDFDDPFALTGAFQICADLHGQETRFVELGEILLDRLIGDLGRLENACEIFGAAFVISTAHLAKHNTLRLRPPFWRRVIAASHASLVVRASGVTDVKQDKLFDWALSAAGASYYLSVFNEFSVEPRWRPEWINTQVLVADIVGRVANTFHSIPGELAPKSWQTRVDRGWAEIEKRQLQLISFFPALSEGARSSAKPDMENLPFYNEPCLRFKEDPSVDNFLILSASVFTFGFPDDARADVLKVVKSLLCLLDNLDDEKIENALTLAAHIAAQTNDADIADAVAEICLELVRTTRDFKEVSNTVFKLVECSSVIPDGDVGRGILAQRLEVLAFLLSESDSLNQLSILLEELKHVDPGMAPRLGRAIAAAKIGQHR